MRLLPSIFRYTILFALGSTIGIANAAPGSQKPASQTASVETSRDIQGNWHGIFNSQLGKLRLVLKISKAPDGALRAECNEAFPKLRAEFKELTSKIEKQPAVFESTNLINGKREQITLSRNIFSEQIRTMLYIPIYWRWLPVLIHEANANNFGPFASIAFTNLRPLIGQLAGGMSLSVVCAEDVPFITEDEIKRDTAGTFYGDYRVRTSIKACEQWPRAKVATTFSEPVKSDAPILMITGELDPVAPPWLATAAARVLPNSRQISIRNTGHYFRFECLENLSAEFLSKASVKGLDISCVKDIERLPFITKLPPQLAK